MSTRTRLAAALVPLLVLAACSGGDDAETADAAGASEVTAAPLSSEATGTGTATDTTGPEAVSAAECTDVDGELIAADSRDGEPTLKIPALDGWENDSSMNSELIRLALVNPDLVQNDFAPNIVVTAEPSPADEQAALDRQFAGLEQASGATDLTREDGEVCGFASFVADYELPEMGAVPARPARARVIVVPNGDQTITYTLTAQATAPIDPAYSAAVEEAFSGVQISG